MNPSASETTETKACKFNLDFLIPITILSVVTFLLSVAENVLVSVAIVVDRRLRRPSNGYLLSLALSDICISFGLIPLKMTYVWSYPKWPLNPRETNVFLNSVWIFSTAGSFVAVLVITVDRYIQDSPVSCALQRSCILGQNFGDYHTGLAVRSGCSYTDESICL